MITRYERYVGVDGPVVVLRPGTLQEPDVSMHRDFAAMGYWLKGDLILSAYANCDEDPGASICVEEPASALEDILDDWQAGWEIDYLSEDAQALWPKLRTGFHEDIEEEEAEHDVVVEVYGGVADFTYVKPGLKVNLIDHDVSEEDEEDGS